MRKRLCIAFLCAFSILSPALHADTPPPSPSGSTYVTTVSSSLSFFDPFYQHQLSTVDNWDIYVWSMPGNSIALSFSASSIEIGDSTTLIDGMSTPAVFDMLAHATVEKAMALGQLPAATSSAEPKYTVVLFPSCVSRSGMGSSTTFSRCGSGTASIAYRYYTSSGSPVITRLGSASDGCSENGCESTLPSGGLQ